MLKEKPRDKLKQLIQEYGYDLGDDPRRCEALLRDYCGQDRREIFALVNALKEGVAQEFLKSSNTVPIDLLLARLTKHLQENLGISGETASWAVNSWALALGVISSPQENSFEENNGQTTDSNSLITENQEYKKKLHQYEEELEAWQQKVEVLQEKLATSGTEKKEESQELKNLRNKLEQKNKIIEETKKINFGLIGIVLLSVITTFGVGTHFYDQQQELERALYIRNKQNDLLREHCGDSLKEDIERMLQQHRH